jgi:uncharacterized protein YndB with AHSA1/START domain
METEPFVIERTYNAPIAKVWDAITNQNKMNEWYFKIDDFKPEVGFEFQFEGTGGEGVKYIMFGKVTEVIPGKKLSHSWLVDGHPGNTHVTWELFDEGDKTRLKVTHSGLETLAQNPDFARENYAYGWTHLTDSLADFLEKE